MSEEMRHALQKGYEIEGYRIEKVLGAGGFGVTYLAHEVSINRKVAIKEYLPSGIAARGRDDVSVHPISSGDRDNFNWGLERFKQEAKTLVTFRHPHIVSVYRYFEANGTAFLVMAYEEGESLAKLLENGATLTESEILEILGPLLSGLEHVHKVGFLHRDIKPGNIYIRRDGSPVLLDFGAARQAMGGRSQSLTSIVSAGYAPFEQYTTRGNQGPWTDIYAFGGVLYRAVTGERPPDAPDRIRNDPYVPCRQIAAGKYSDAMLAAIDAALQVDEDKRPQSVAEWRAMFEGMQPAASPFAPYSGAATGTTLAAGVGASAQRATGRPPAGMTAATVAPNGASAAAGAVPTGAPRKSRTGLALAVILGGLVLLGGAGAGAYFYLDGASQAETTALIGKARDAIAAGALDDAEKLLADAEKRKKDHPELAGLKESLKSAREAQAAKRREADALLARARTAIQQRNYPLAEQLIEQAARVLPSHPDLAALRESLRTARDSAAKEEQVRRLAAQARQAIRARNYDEAQRQIDELARVAPDHAELAVLRAELQAARDGMAKEEQARRLLVQAREAIRAKRFDDAQRLIDEAAKIAPGLADVDAARRELASARGTGPDGSALDRLLEEARAAIARRDFDTAKRKLDEAERIAPNDAGIAALRKQIADLQGTSPTGERTAVPNVVTSPVNMCKAGSMRFVNATRRLTLPGERYCAAPDWKVREAQTDGPRLYWRVIFSDGHVNCQCDRTGAATGPAPPSTGMTPIPGVTTTPNHLCVADSQRMLRTTRRLSRPGRTYCTEAQWKVAKTETDGTNVFWEVPFDDGAVYCVCRRR